MLPYRPVYLDTLALNSRGLEISQRNIVALQYRAYDLSVLSIYQDEYLRLRSLLSSCGELSLVRLLYNCTLYPEYINTIARELELLNIFLNNMQQKDYNDQTIFSVDLPVLVNICHNFHQPDIFSYLNNARLLPNTNMVPIPALAIIEPTPPVVTIIPEPDVRQDTPPIVTIIPEPDVRQDTPPVVTIIPEPDIRQATPPIVTIIPELDVTQATPPIVTITPEPDIRQATPPVVTIIPEPDVRQDTPPVVAITHTPQQPFIEEANNIEEEEEEELPKTQEQLLAIAITTLNVNEFNKLVKNNPSILKIDILTNAFRKIFNSTLIKIQNNLPNFIRKIHLSPAICHELQKIAHNNDIFLALQDVINAPQLKLQKQFHKHLKNEHASHLPAALQEIMLNELHLAVDKLDVERVKLLLKKGANHNLINPETGQTAKDLIIDKINKCTTHKPNIREQLLGMAKELNVEVTVSFLTKTSKYNPHTLHLDFTEEAVSIASLQTWAIQQYGKINLVMLKNILKSYTASENDTLKHLDIENHDNFLHILLRNKNITEEEALKALNIILSKQDLNFLRIIFATKNNNGNSIITESELRGWKIITKLLGDNIISLVKNILNNKIDLKNYFKYAHDYFNNKNSTLIHDKLKLEEYRDIQHIIETRHVIRENVSKIVIPENSDELHTLNNLISEIFGTTEYSEIQINIESTNQKQSLIDYVTKLFNNGNKKIEVIMHSNLVANIYYSEWLADTYLWSHIMLNRLTAIAAETHEISLSRIPIDEDCNKNIESLFNFASQKNISPNKRNHDNLTIIDYAAIIGDIALIEKIITVFPNAEITSLTLLNASVSNKNNKNIAELFTYLFNLYENRRINNSKLTAILDIVDSNGRDLLSCAATTKNNCIDKIKWLQQYGFSSIKTYQDDRNLIQNIILNTGGMQNVSQIDTSNALELIKHFLSNDETSKQMVQHRDVFGHTALEHAMKIIPKSDADYKFAYEIFDLLIDKGANLQNISNDGKNILHVIAENYNEKYKQHIASKIMHSAQKTCVSIIHMLNHEDIYGKTPKIMFAQQTNQPKQIPATMFNNYRLMSVMPLNIWAKSQTEKIDLEKLQTLLQPHNTYSIDTKLMLTRDHGDSFVHTLLRNKAITEESAIAALKIIFATTNLNFLRPIFATKNKAGNSIITMSESKNWNQVTDILGQKLVSLIKELIDQNLDIDEYFANATDYFNNQSDNCVILQKFNAGEYELTLRIMEKRHQIRSDIFKIVEHKKSSNESDLKLSLYKIFGQWDLAEVSCGANEPDETKPLIELVHELYESNNHEIGIIIDSELLNNFYEALPITQTKAWREIFELFYTDGFTAECQTKLNTFCSNAIQSKKNLDQPDNQGATMLHYAALLGDKDFINTLIMQLKLIITPKVLFLACESDKNDIAFIQYIFILYENQIRNNSELPKIIDIRDAIGIDLLSHTTIYSKNVDKVRFLLKYNFPINNVYPSGSNLLQCVITNTINSMNHPQQLSPSYAYSIIELFFSHTDKDTIKKMITHKDKIGLTALEYAINMTINPKCDKQDYKSITNILDLLLSNGANVFNITNDNRRIFDFIDIADTRIKNYISPKVLKIHNQQYANKQRVKPNG